MDLQGLLDEFPGYLEENRLASERHIPYLAGWVRRYLAGPYEVSQPNDRLLVFLDRLERNPAVADWQVRQAEEAVRLFRLYVGTRPRRHEANLPAGPWGSQVAPPAAGLPRPLGPQSPHGPLNRATGKTSRTQRTLKTMRLAGHMSAGPRVVRSAGIKPSPTLRPRRPLPAHSSPVLK